ncbi:hypothetical protein ISCGN_018756 [Ixodes scapularis]
MEWDQGGLLYPSEKLYHLVMTLENHLTKAFSTSKLHASIMYEIVGSLKGLPKVGCADHCDCHTRSVVKFYCITRMHFFLKGKNRTERTRSKEQKLKKKKV